MNREELLSILKHSKTIEDIDKYRSEIINYIPITSIMMDFDQMNRYHQYFLWEHTLHALINLRNEVTDDMVYLALLYHDIGKVEAQFRKKSDNEMHYTGHPLISERIGIFEICPILFKEEEDDLRERFLYYVRHHDDRIELNEDLINKIINDIGEEGLFNLSLIQEADALSHNMLPVIENKIKCARILIEKYRPIKSL